MNALNQSNIANYFRVVDLLACERGESLAHAAEQIVTGQRRASHRARRAARKILYCAAPWPAINAAAGYLRPGTSTPKHRPALRLVDPPK